MSRELGAALGGAPRALLVLCALAGCARAVRYGFYRGERGERGGDARRVFGGRAAAPDAAAGLCALLDRYWAARCSGAALAPRWALTAAHCVAPRVAYVRCGAPGAEPVAAHYLYRHPGYRVEGRGDDVTLLHHDVGLVRTRRDLRADAAPLAALRLYDAAELVGRDVLVLGFGRTEGGALGAAASEVRLRVASCERAEWRRCACGAARPGEAARGVCAGDSGGPVLYGGAQVALTSMGPLECAAGAPPEGATSVFTALLHYADLINATISDAEEALRMRVIAAAPAPPRAALAPLALTALARAPLACC